jgi:hypothetical protein
MAKRAARIVRIPNGLAGLQGTSCGATWRRGRPTPVCVRTFDELAGQTLDEL